MTEQERRIFQDSTYQIHMRQKIKYNCELRRAECLSPQDCQSQCLGSSEWQCKGGELGLLGYCKSNDVKSTNDFECLHLGCGSISIYDQVIRVTINRHVALMPHLGVYGIGKDHDRIVPNPITFRHVEPSTLNQIKHLNGIAEARNPLDPFKSNIKPKKNYQIVLISPIDPRFTSFEHPFMHIMHRNDVRIFFPSPTV